MQHVSMLKQCPVSRVHFSAPASVFSEQEPRQRAFGPVLARCQEAGGCQPLKAGGYVNGKAGGHEPYDRRTLLSTRERRGRWLLGNEGRCPLNAGRVNRVMEIERPLLGQRHLYALNESTFFVTAEHPFMTEEGWKSIDPPALTAEGSTLPVGKLTVGDRLLTLAAVAVPVDGGSSARAEAFDMRVEAVALHSLVGQPADPATQLYNLRLDGNHTYFANDLLAHNK